MIGTDRVDQVHYFRIAQYDAPKVRYVWLSADRATFWEEPLVQPTTEIESMLRDLEMRSIDQASWPAMPTLPNGIIQARV